MAQWDIKLSLLIQIAKNQVVLLNASVSDNTDEAVAKIHVAMDNTKKLIKDVVDA